VWTGVESKATRREGGAGRVIGEIHGSGVTEAESAVRREAIPEEETQLRRQRWGWVEPEVWTDRMLAALDNGVKGGCWYSLMDKVHAKRTLEASWRRVRANAGAAGVDGESVKRFAANAERYLEELSTALREGRYQPQGVRRVYLPKPGGGQRPLGIPVVKDRIVQGALKLVLEPIFEREFCAWSYGFRPGRGAKDALREVDGLLKGGATWVVDADLKSYFDTIPHDRLMDRVRSRVRDGRVLKLIESYLKQEIMDGTQRWTPMQGSPQGAVLSPLLANLYLHEMDVELGERFRLVRYADDFVVLCTSEAEAQSALEAVQAWTQQNGLTLHPEKTHVGDARQPGQGFDFLGYRFEGGRRVVRRKSLNALCDRIRSKTRRSRGSSMKQIIADLNPMLRGWFAYFQHAHFWVFQRLDGMIRRRLRAIRRKQQKRPGRGSTHEDHRRWPNRYFAELGLFSLAAAHARASQSR